MVNLIGATLWLQQLGRVLKQFAFASRYIPDTGKKRNKRTLTFIGGMEPLMMENRSN